MFGNSNGPFSGLCRDDISSAHVLFDPCKHLPIIAPLIRLFKVGKSLDPRP